MEVNRTEKITFRCTALEKAALAEQAARCGISTSEYCRTLALGGRPKERYTEEERELFREIARLKGTLQRLNNYFGGRQYREVFEENQALINELKNPNSFIDAATLFICSSVCVLALLIYGMSSSTFFNSYCNSPSFIR